MQNIKKTLISDENILLIDECNKVWILGNNEHRKIGFGIASVPMIRPIDTEIILSYTETIDSFYCYKYLLCIYTSLGKLYISKNLYTGTSTITRNNNWQGQRDDWESSDWFDVHPTPMHDIRQVNIADSYTANNIQYSGDLNGGRMYGGRMYVENPYGCMTPPSEGCYATNICSETHSPQYTRQANIESRIITPESNYDLNIDSTVNTPELARIVNTVFTSASNSPVVSRGRIRTNDNSNIPRTSDFTMNGTSALRYRMASGSVSPDQCINSNTTCRRNSRSASPITRSSQSSSNMRNSRSASPITRSSQSPRNRRNFEMWCNSEIVPDLQPNESVGTGFMDSRTPSLSPIGHRIVANRRDESVSPIFERSSPIRQRAISDRSSPTRQGVAVGYMNSRTPSLSPIGHRIVANRRDESVSVLTEYPESARFTSESGSPISVISEYTSPNRQRATTAFLDSRTISASPIRQRMSAPRDSVRYYGARTVEQRPVTAAVGFNMIVDVSRCIFIGETIIFEKDEKLYVYNQNIKAENLLDYSIKMIPCNSYYQIILPFDYDLHQVYFSHNFVYIKLGTFNYIISAMISKHIVWAYFKSEKQNNIHASNIYYDIHSGTIYIKIIDTIYMHNKNELVPITAQNNKIIIKSTNTEKISIICINEKGVYSNNNCNNIIKRINCNDLNKNIVDMKYIYSGHYNIALVDTTETFIYLEVKDTIYFNINKLKNYKLLDIGLLYHYEHNIYFCTHLNMLDAKESSKININRQIIHFYTPISTPMPITSLVFDNKMILIESNNKYYYSVINESKKSIFKFVEIQKATIVSKYLVTREIMQYQSNVTVHITKSCNKFKKLHNLISMFGNRIGFSITYEDHLHSVSYGIGPKREFLETAMIEFCSKYLISGNKRTMFGDAIKSFDDNELIHIGMMIHAVICHSGVSLPIRLPISLLSEILGKRPSIDDLEYFAQTENKDIYTSIQEHKNDLATIGYDNYQECLMQICKYDPNNFNRECKNIAMGFISYKKIACLNIMNLPTLDYYLSGDYGINRKTIISKLKIYNNTESRVNYEDTMKKIIIDLPEEKLVILLNNWTGMSVVNHTFVYAVSIIKTKSTRLVSDIKFLTCNTRIEVESCLIDDNLDLFIELITTPMVTMKD